MTHSMSGFAALKGHHGAWSWTWDIRAVNARGLDIRLKLPDWIEGLETAVRKAVAGAVARGNVSVALRLGREATTGETALDPAALDRALGMIAKTTRMAEQRGLVLAPPTAIDIAGMRGVAEAAPDPEDVLALRHALIADLDPLLAAFNEMRAHEGATLGSVLKGQLAEVEVLVREARELLDDRREAQAEGLRTALARVLENVDGADPDRVAQELALIAVKTDVREELDRLDAHVGQARSLLAGDAPRGRKLDFLMQEFNREANTLCSKAQFQPLTRVGLDLKAVVDQMREQVQNVE